MDAIWAALVSVAGTGFLGLVGAVVMRKLVPASHVAEARAEADKWRLAYEEKSAAHEKLEALVERQQIVAETVNQVLAAIKQTAQTQGGGQS